MNAISKHVTILIITLGITGCSGPKEQVSIRAMVSPEGTLKISSPDGKNIIQFMIVDGKPMYQVSRGGEDIIEPSRMGFAFKGENRSLGQLELIAADTSSYDETWEQVWGEKRHIRNHYRQLSVSLGETDNARRKLNIEFRAYDDGIAFRYVYPQQGENDLPVF